MNELILTDDQKKLILENHEKLNLLKLTHLISGNEELDGRSAEGRAVKKYLGEMSLDYKTSKHEKVPERTLSMDQEEFVRNNAASMNATEMARILFKNPNITQLNKETRVIYDFIQTLPPEIVRPQDEIPDGTYSPPKAISRAVGKINRFCNISWDESKLSSREKECSASLIRYLNSYRFLAMINAYQNQTHRDLFESQFIFHVYDKADLISEEVNTYLNLCSEYVIQSAAQEQKELLDAKLRRLIDDVDGKMSIALNEAVSGKADEISASVIRQKNLINDLVGERKKRVANKANDNASLANLFELWKNKEERDTIVKLNNQRRKIVEQEIDRLGSMDDYMAKIQGLSRDEVLYS